MFSCSECDYTTPRKSNFNRHMKRHNDIAPDHNIPPKIARHEPIPNIIEPTENDEFLSDIQQKEIQDMFEPNAQVGFGITRITPVDENVPQELRDFFRDERPWGTDRNLRQVYVQNFGRIRDSETHNRRSVFSSDIYAMIVHLLSKPLPKPLKISFVVKAMFSRSICLFHLFYNTERLESSVISTLAIINKF